MLNLVIIPRNIANLMSSNNLPLSAAIDPDKISSTLSTDDVLKYRAVNQFRDQLLFVTLGDCFKPTELSVYNESNIEPVDNNYNRANYKLGEYLNSGDYNNAIVDYYFNPLELNVPTISEIQYEVITLNPDTIAIVPQYSNIKGLSLTDVYEDLLIHLKGRTTFDTIAKTQLFIQFVNNL